MADVEAMFFQVSVPENERDYFRFLWWPNGDSAKSVREYRMVVHLFGATSSPSVCNYALRRLPIDFECSDEVAVTIQRHFYVDDCLRATADPDLASKLIENLVSLCAKGGFHLHKLVSNDRSVLKSIPQCEMGKQVQSLNFDEAELPIERSLGLQWFVETDEFGFCFKPKEHPCTRRGILSASSSIYDPLGIVAPFVLPAKLLLQELCRMGFDWDDQLPNAMVEAWDQIRESLSQIALVRLKRSLPSKGDGRSIQMHVFADASSEAYGAVAYLRVVYDSGVVSCHFLMGKCRVKPLRAVTIPRLELSAATVAAKLGVFLARELDLSADCTVFHTDSTSVLHFLNNTHARFPVFVANRVQLILDLSSASQWRHVRSSDNPADVASRGTKISEENVLSWLKGPEFLWREESLWPKSECISDDVQEVAFEVDVVETLDPDGAFDRLVGYYSSWSRLKKAVCVFIKFVKFLI